MRRNFCFLIVLFCLCSHYCKVLSQTWIPIYDTVAGETLTKKILRSDASSYQVKIQIQGLYDNPQRTKVGLFHQLSLGTNLYKMDIGKPALPCISQIVAIPPDATISVSLTNHKWNQVKIGTIIPAQDPHTSSSGMLPLQDAGYYSKFYAPPLYILGKEMEWRGIRYVCISICPFKYLPADSLLSVMSEFVLKVDFVQQNTQRTIRLQEINDDLNLFDNTPFSEATESNKKLLVNNNSYNYLIIVGSSSITNNSVFSEKMKEFRRWKALKGFKTKVVTTNEIGTSANSIRNYIQQEYQNGVQYVLFVGDSNLIPTESKYFSGDGKTIFGDYWYGCWNSDLAYLPIGRFAINTTNDFKNMVDKTIKYESSYKASPKALLIAHYEGAPSAMSYQGCCEAIRTASYTAPITFVTAYGSSTSNSGNNATNQDVINQINSGVQIVNYRGHAAVDYWGSGTSGNASWNVQGEAFSNSQISHLNSSTCVAFFSVACSSGNINSSSECMLERFTRSDHGAVSFVGSTASIETSANSVYDILLFKTLIGQSVYNLGNMNLRAHIQNINTFGIGTGNEYFAVENAYSYICGGDPSLEIWTALPNTISNIKITPNSGSLTLYTGLSGDYKIAVVSENGDLISLYNASTSTYSITKPSGKFYISVFKHNYFPYVIYYDTESNYIQNKTFTNDAYYEGTPLEIGYGVTANEEDGTVKVKSGHKLIIKNGSGGVLFDTDFECEKGAMLEVK